MKDVIYLKIEIPGNNEEIEEIREEGLFFETIADSLYLERENIIEIDETNYENICKEIMKKYGTKPSRKHIK